MARRGKSCGLPMTHQSWRPGAASAAQTAGHHVSCRPPHQSQVVCNPWATASVASCCASRESPHRSKAVIQACWPLRRLQTVTQRVKNFCNSLHFIDLRDGLGWLKLEGDEGWRSELRWRIGGRRRAGFEAWDSVTGKGFEVDAGTGFEAEGGAGDR